MATYQDLTPHRAGDNKVIFFSLEPKKNEEKSREAGHLVADDAEYIEIRLLNDSSLVVKDEVSDKHRAEFAPQYAAFKLAQESSTTGFPVREWGGCTRGQAETLAAAGVKTVEQLKDADDKKLEAFGFEFPPLKAKAKIFLERAQGGQAAVEIHAARVQELESSVAVKDDEIKGLRAKLAELEATKKSK